MLNNSLLNKIKEIQELVPPGKTKYKLDPLSFDNPNIISKKDKVKKLKDKGLDCDAICSLLNLDKHFVETIK